MHFVYESITNPAVYILLQVSSCGPSSSRGESQKVSSENKASPQSPVSPPISPSVVYEREVAANSKARPVYLTLANAPVSSPPVASQAQTQVYAGYPPRSTYITPAMLTKSDSTEYATHSVMFAAKASPVDSERLSFFDEVTRCVLCQLMRTVLHKSALCRLRQLYCLGTPFAYISALVFLPFLLWDESRLSPFAGIWFFIHVSIRGGLS